MVFPQTARIFASLNFFLDVSEEEEVDADDAAEMKERLGAQLKGFGESFLRELSDAFAFVALEYEGAARQMIRDIPREFDLAEVVAGGDLARRSDRSDGVTTALQVAKIVAYFRLFLNVSGEERFDADDAVGMTEWLCVQLEQLDRDFLRGLIDAFPVIAPEYDPAVQQAVRDIPLDYGLEEAVAADDPVRLAELERLRDLRDASRM